MTGLHWFADVQWFSMLLTGQFGIWHDITIYYPFSDIPTSIGTSVHVGGQKYGLWMCGIHTFGYFWGMKWHQWSAIYRSFHCPTFPAKKNFPKKKTDIVGVLRIFVEVPCLTSFGWNLPKSHGKIHGDPGSQGSQLTRPKSGTVFLHLPRMLKKIHGTPALQRKIMENDPQMMGPHLCHIQLLGTIFEIDSKTWKKNWSGTFMFWCPPVKNSRPRPFLDNITSLPCLWSAKKRCPSPGGEFITHKEQLQSLLKISSHLEIQIIQNLFGLGNWVSTKWPTLTATKTSIQGARDKEGTWYSSSHSIVSPTLCPINPRLTILTSSHLTWQWKLSIFNWWIKTHAGDITGVVTYIQDGKKKLKSWWPPWTTRTFHKWVV